MISSFLSIELSNMISRFYSMIKKTSFLSPTIPSLYSKQLYNQSIRSSCFLRFKHLFINQKLALFLQHHSITREFPFLFNTIDIINLDFSHLMHNSYMNTSNIHLRTSYVFSISNTLQTIVLNASSISKCIYPFMKLII